MSEREDNFQKSLGLVKEDATYTLHIELNLIELD